MWVSLFSAEQWIQARPPASWMSFLTAQLVDKRAVISFSAFLTVWPCMAFVFFFFLPPNPALELHPLIQNTVFSVFHIIKEACKRNTFWLRLIFFFPARQPNQKVNCCHSHNRDSSLHSASWVTEQSGPIPHLRIQFPLPNLVKEEIQNNMQPWIHRPPKILLPLNLISSLRLGSQSSAYPHLLHELLLPPQLD